MEKQEKKKDSYLEIMKELERYYEGTAPINSQFAFDTCACNHELENHCCNENCEEYPSNKKKAEKKIKIAKKKATEKKVKVRKRRKKLNKKG